MAGVGLGAALATWGHSERDTENVVRWLALVYEAADLLYDHLHLAPPGDLDKDIDSRGEPSTHLLESWSHLRSEVQRVYNEDPVARATINKALIGQALWPRLDESSGLANATKDLVWSFAKPFVEERRLIDPSSPMDAALAVIALLEDERRANVTRDAGSRADADTRVGRSSRARSLLDQLLDGCPDPRAMKDLIAAAVDDVVPMVKGAGFGWRGIHDDP